MANIDLTLVNTGSAPNSGTGTPLQESFEILNENMNLISAQFTTDEAITNAVSNVANTALALAQNGAAYQVDVYLGGVKQGTDVAMDLLPTPTANVHATSNGSLMDIAVSANAAAVLAGVISGNTSNVSISYLANGNVSIDTRLSGGGGGGGNYQADVYANSGLVLSNAVIQLVNSATTNAVVTANGTFGANITYVANSTALGIPALNSAVAAANSAFSTTNTTFGTLNTSITSAQTRVWVNGSSIGNTRNLNIIAANTSNLSITGTLNASPGNVTVSIDTLVAGGSTQNASISQRGVTLLIDSTSSTDTGNAATANAVSTAAAIGNSANFTAQSAVALAAAAYLLANVAVANVSSGNTSNIVISGNATNVIIDTAFSGGGGGSGNYEVDVYANGVIVHTNANLNFINSTSMNAYVLANGSTQVNVTFNVNTTMNLVSLNVSGNISNAGNVIVTQNIAAGNVKITTLANTAMLNISANIANAGNVLVTQNTYTGNLRVTTLANTGTLNISGNIANAGNVLVTQNLFAGNLSITQNGAFGNVSAANLAVTTSVTTGNLNVSTNTTVGNLMFANSTGAAPVEMTYNSTSNSLDVIATGTPALPAVIFGTENNTSMYLISTGSNTIGFSCNSNGVMNVAQGIVQIYGAGANTPILSLNTAATTGSSNAGLTSGNLTNKPGSSNSTTKWIPIFIDGVEYYLVAWGK